MLAYRDRIRRFRAANPVQERAAFYAAEERVYAAIVGFIERHIAAIERKLAAETRPELAASLREMLACNRNVATRPPATFLEACQWMAWFATVSRIYDRDGAGCALDVLLHPCYARDKAAGELDDENATFILANLLLIETHYNRSPDPLKQLNHEAHVKPQKGKRVQALCRFTTTATTVDELENLSS